MVIHTSLNKKNYCSYEFKERNGITFDYSDLRDEKIEIVDNPDRPSIYLNRSACEFLTKFFVKFSKGRNMPGWYYEIYRNLSTNDTNKGHGPYGFSIVVTDESISEFMKIANHEEDRKIIQWSYEFPDENEFTLDYENIGKTELRLHNEIEKGRVLSLNKAACEFLARVFIKLAKGNYIPGTCVKILQDINPENKDKPGGFSIVLTD